ncbi:hypothetical protein [Altererythrobacter sp. GH1-8]|uniref:hypothetical protein n=1 Tax=Altererythrobacter sp. GH1-8 TaxID=3349333 RepID=UPI00374D582B
MPAPIATLALVTLGSGLALGGWSYKRAKDAKKKDKYPKLTHALADDEVMVRDTGPSANNAKTVTQNKAASQPA